MKKFYLIAAIVALFAICSSCQMSTQKESKTSSDSIANSGSSEEWSTKNVPVDIMNRIEIGMNVGFLKEKMGEPQKIEDFDNQNIYTWNCKNLVIEVKARNNSIISVSYTTFPPYRNENSYFLEIGSEKIFLGKSTLRMDRDFSELTIDFSGYQNDMDYNQTIRGMKAYNYTNFILSGIASQLTHNDFLELNLDLPISLSKLPSQFKQRVIDDAGKALIYKITLEK